DEEAAARADTGRPTEASIPAFGLVVGQRAVTHREVSAEVILDPAARAVAAVAGNARAADRLVAAERALAEDQRRAAGIRNGAPSAEGTVATGAGAAERLVVREGTVADGEDGLQPLARLRVAVVDPTAAGARAAHPRAAEGLVVGEERVSDCGAAFIVQPAP